MPFRRSIIAILACIAMPACSSTQSAFVEGGAQASRRDFAAKGGAVIYVADYQNSAIEIYSQKGGNPSPLGSVTVGVNFPGRIAVDGKGTLYVTNHGNNSVTEYAKGGSAPSASLTSGIDGPNAISVDQKGNVYVGESANNTIVAFKAGSIKPTLKITSFSQPTGLTNDAENNLYVAWTDAGNVGHVSRCPALRSKCRDLGITIGAAGDVKLDSGGNLVLTDQQHQMINIYAPGTTTPARSYDIDPHDPYAIALDAKDQTLYVADTSDELVLRLKYSNGKQLGTITKGLTTTFGVAASPAQKPGPPF